MMLPHGISKAVAPEISEMLTGTVRWLSSDTKVSANRNSFHAPMKASRPVETIAGASSGMKTSKMMRSGPQPSMIAASSSSFGRPRMKVVRIQTVNGSVNTV